MKTHKLTDGLDSPLAALCSIAEHSRGNHARSDELKRDKKGLWDGGGLKKRVERRDEETFK